MLVADDDDDLRNLMAAALRHDGYDVTEVTDGEELVARIESSFAAASDIPDVVVADVGSRGSACSALGFALMLLGCVAACRQRNEHENEKPSIPSSAAAPPSNVELPGMPGAEEDAGQADAPTGAVLDPATLERLKRLIEERRRANARDGAAPDTPP